MSQTSSRERWFAPRASGGLAVLIATERELPEPDPDENLLLDGLVAAGLDPRLAAWDDAGVDWTAAAVTVIRSTWAYHHRCEQFVTWAQRAAARTQLWNPASVLRWNSHKSYLLDLGGAGVPVVPTVLLPQGAPADLADVMSRHRWTRVVVKPAVSASSYRTLEVDGSTLDEGDMHLRALLAERDVLLQPYISSVENYGERAIIWIDGEFTHAVRKSPRFAAEDEAVSEALSIAEDELIVAQQALAVVAEPLLYARIDLARDDNGRPQVMELELIEPSLYLLQSPEALARLVAAISERARTA